MRKRKVSLLEKRYSVAIKAKNRVVDENLFYKGVDKHKVDPARLTQQGDASSQPVEEHPPFVFHSGDSLLALTKKHNVSCF